MTMATIWLACLLVLSAANTDSFGIRQLYSTKNKGREYVSKWSKSRTFTGTKIDPGDSEAWGRGGSSNTYRVSGSNNELRFSGDRPRYYIMDQMNTTQRTWLNTEATVYGRYNTTTSDSSAGFTIIHRTMHEHYSNDPCTAFSYYHRLRFNDGRPGFVKEYAHVSSPSITMYSGNQNANALWSRTPMNTWIGMKTVTRTQGRNVELEFWIDETEGKNGGEWKLAHSYTDKGDWEVKDPSTLRKYCPNRGSKDVNLGTGTSIILRSDFTGTEGVRWKWFTIREVDPLN